ncbi:hypothetical protein BC936DRAFT_136728 [Jimgerdemannia flammicorona]|uniref:Uncharacterized protein n=1 Tax=Jimgerdemannia flammicorona TaxID=994334 RepID=A0A433DJD6_9FUNG|nr:hypothetical protein BC936DRAFT_136728 [Jimgerdemannia flammicorona]
MPLLLKSMRPTAIMRFATRPRTRFAADDGPSLDFFITRSKVISLYRDILRALKSSLSAILPI